MNLEDITELIKALKKYNLNKRYKDILYDPKNKELTDKLRYYKENFLNEELEKEKVKSPDIIIENPYVGDLIVCLIHILQN